MQAEGNHGRGLQSILVSHHSTKGIPGEPGAAVQSEPPSVGQREAPGEETEKGLREVRREGAKGRNTPEGSQVGQVGTRFSPRSRYWKASQPCCCGWTGVWPIRHGSQEVGDSHVKSHSPWYCGQDPLRATWGCSGRHLLFIILVLFIVIQGH